MHKELGGDIVPIPPVSPRQLLMATSHHDHKEMRLSSLRPHSACHQAHLRGCQLLSSVSPVEDGSQGFMHARQAFYLTVTVMHCPPLSPTSASASARIHRHHENGQENSPPGVSQRTDPGCAPRVSKTASPVQSTENQEGSESVGEMVRWGTKGLFFQPERANCVSPFSEPRLP